MILAIRPSGLAAGMIRLILTEHSGGIFEAHREDTGEVVVRSRRPLYDGARVLLNRGESPEILLTMRHARLGCDSFAAKPIGYWAVLMLEEGRFGIRTRKWKPHPVQNMI